MEVTGSNPVAPTKKTSDRDFTRTKILLLILLSFFVISCGARLPSPRTSQKVIAKHFKKYGKKYKESDFGVTKVERVEVEGADEIQKDLAATIAFVYLREGPVYHVRVTLVKKAFGWRYVSWENLGKR